MKNIAQSLSFQRSLVSGELPAQNLFRCDLPLLELRSGMVLASPLDLTEPGGATLQLPAGLVLSVATLDLLFAYKVDKASVYQPDGCRANERPDERPDELDRQGQPDAPPTGRKTV